MPQKYRLGWRPGTAVSSFQDPARWQPCGMCGEVARRLTGIVVLVIVLVVVVVLLGHGYGPTTAVEIITVSGLAAAAISSRLDDPGSASHRTLTPRSR